MEISAIDLLSNQGNVLSTTWHFMAISRIGIKPENFQIGGPRVEMSPPFNAKLCKISGECGKFCKERGGNGEELLDSPPPPPPPPKKKITPNLTSF